MAASGVTRRMMVAHSSRSARRLLNRNVLGRASALLFVLACSCMSSKPQTDVTSKPPATAASEAARATTATPVLEKNEQSAPVAASPAEPAAANKGVGVAPSAPPQKDAAAAKPALPARADALKQAESFGMIGGLGLSGTGQGGGGIA